MNTNGAILLLKIYLFSFLIKVIYLIYIYWNYSQYKSLVFIILKGIKKLV